MSRKARFHTIVESADLLGISAKALRVYERHGLVTPDRSPSGYRLYGPAQMRRLHQVVTLKSLGLSLAQIGVYLAGLGDDMGPLLEAQEAALRLRIKTLETAVEAVATARRRIAAGQTLSVDDLVILTKEILMSEAQPDWRKALAPLFAKHFSEAERKQMMQGPANPAALASQEQERKSLLDEARLLVGTDPGAPAALDLAKRWRDRAMGFTGGDAPLLGRLRAALDEALDNPELAGSLPWREELAFIRSATERLEAKSG